MTTTVVNQLKHISELEKKAYVDYVTSFATSSISALVQGGISLPEASGMVKLACESDGRASALKNNIDLFEKVAEYVSNLEHQLGEAQARLNLQENETMTKLSGLGFSSEELTQMSSLPEDVLTKVAGMKSTPWEMGHGTGFSREQTDPVLEFILG